MEPWVWLTTVQRFLQVSPGILLVCRTLVRQCMELACRWSNRHCRGRSTYHQAASTTLNHTSSHQHVRSSAQSMQAAKEKCQQRARAVLLVKVSAHGELELTDEGKALLNSPRFNTCQLLVVSVAGPARSGKSTLLNVLLQRMDCDPCEGKFAVGDTTEDTTKGIWMWSQPLSINDKQQHQLVLMDVEGNNTMQQNAEYTKAICCLAYIISSVLVWNVMRTIDHAFFDSMAHLASATSVIITDAQKQQQNQEQPPGAADVDNNQGAGGSNGQADVADVAHMKDIGRCGPALLVVIRDALSTKHSTGLDYLRSQLSVENPGRYSRDQLTAVQATRSLFHAHNCIMVPYPQAGAPNMFGSLTDQQLGPVVVSTLEEIRHNLHNASIRAVNSRPNGHKPTGMLLASFIEKCIELINARGRLYTPSLCDDAAKHVNAKLAQKTKSAFFKRASAQLSNEQQLLAPDGPLKLRHELEAIAEEYLQRFTKESLGSAAEKEGLKSDLRNALFQYINCTYNLAENTQKTLQDKEAKNAAEAKAELEEIWTSHAQSLAESWLPVCRFRSEACTREKFTQLVETKLRKRWEEVQKAPQNESNKSWLPWIWRACQEARVDSIQHAMSRHGNMLNRIIEKQLKACLAEQVKANTQTLDMMVACAYVIKRKTSGNLLHIDGSSRLRAKAARDSKETDTEFQHVFVSAVGIPLLRKMKEGDVVGVYHIESGTLWTAVETRNLPQSTVRGSYCIVGSGFRLGSRVPEACRFKVMIEGSNFCLDSGLQAGFVTREWAAPGRALEAAYALESKSDRSYFRAAISSKDVAGFASSTLKENLTAANVIVDKNVPLQRPSLASSDITYPMTDYDEWASLKWD